MQASSAIALGSNLGDRARTLDEAVTHMRTLGQVRALSTYHDTTPELYLEQPRFLNAAALLRTDLPPLELLAKLLEIERTMGRTRVGVPAKGPRLIDLDLLLYDATCITSPELILPHPALHERRFVLAPLAEIAPEMLHPVLGITVAEMLKRLR